MRVDFGTAAQCDGSCIAYFAGTLPLAIFKELRIRAQRHTNARKANRNLSGKCRASTQPLCVIPGPFLAGKKLRSSNSGFRKTRHPNEVGSGGRFEPHRRLCRSIAATPKRKSENPRLDFRERIRRSSDQCRTVCVAI